MPGVKGGPRSVEGALRSPDHPVLGEIDLVQSYRDFIKWNPADDLCEHCRVLVELWPRETIGCSVMVQRLRASD